MGELSVRDLSGILKACRTSGVTKLKFRDLDVEFGPQASEPTVTVGPDLRNLSIPELQERYQRLKKKVSTPLPTGVAEIQDQEAEKALVADEIALREQELAEMWVTNPQKAEELLMQGDLRDNGPEIDEEA